MTDDTIIKLAREAGMVPISFNRTSFETEQSAFTSNLRKFAELVAAEEREIIKSAMADAQGELQQHLTDVFIQGAARGASLNRWFPIETAPVNEWVLVANGDDCDMARKHDTGRWYNCQDWGLSLVTHWMPLPLAPKGGE